MNVSCARHPGRPGGWGLATHYLGDDVRWSTVIQVEQTFGPFCGECRLELIEWACHPAPEDLSEAERAVRRTRVLKAAQRLAGPSEGRSWATDYEELRQAVLALGIDTKSIPVV